MGNATGMASGESSFIDQAVRLLRDNRRRIVLNWAARVGALPVFRAHPELDLVAVLDEAPALFDDILELAENGGVNGHTRDLGPVRDHAAAHTAGRIALGFHAADIAAEYRQFRNVLWSELRLHAAALNPTVAEVLAFEERINDALDAILVVALDAYEHRPPAEAE